MTIKCTKYTDESTIGLMGHEGEVTSCRFYAFQYDENDPDVVVSRIKVHVDGPVKYKDVKKAYSDLGVDVEESELKAAYEE